VELRKWPRKNDAESIEARRAALDGRVDAEVFELDVTPWVSAQEALTGVSVTPTAVIGPLTISLGDYELTEPDGALVERGRSTEEVFVPLAHTEGSLSDSLYRGARAAADSGGFRTEVLRDRITRASAFVTSSVEEAVSLGRWVEGELPKMREWLAGLDEQWVSRYAKLREVETYVAGPICHVMWAFTTGDACGPNMMTRNAYALNMGYVMEHAPRKPERAILEANMGGDKKASHRYFERGGHGKTVLAEVTLTEDAVRRVLRTTVDDLLDLSFAGTHGAVASGMQSVAFTPASAIAAIFAATGQDLGMVGTSSMAHGTGRRAEGGIHCGLRLPGLEVGTVGGGTVFPYARTWLELMDCAGAGKVYRFAQIVAAATLALEISASAAMATAGSENFFKAHHERGGQRHSGV
jgi:hydroxymethylglutaryl-CoA reductase (NADPH)